MNAEKPSSIVLLFIAKLIRTKKKTNWQTIDSIRYRLHQ